MKNATMRQAIFHTLYGRLKEGSSGYVPVHELMGERYIKETKQWAFVSYEVSARCSAMMKENPGLLERVMVTGKSGARYYAYRISPSATPDLIRDETLMQFYRAIGGRRTESAHEKMMRENREAVANFDKAP